MCAMSVSPYDVGLTLCDSCGRKIAVQDARVVTIESKEYYAKSNKYEVCVECAKKISNYVVDKK